MTTIEEKVIKATYHAYKSLLFDKDIVSVKKDNSEFAVIIGSYDGLELCKLVGLYRDDGLGYFENISGPDSEKMKKKLFKIFKNNGLNVAVEFNFIVIDSLDVTFDLKSASYYPYRKQ